MTGLAAWLWPPPLTPRRAAAPLIVVRLVFGYHLLQYAVPTLLDPPTHAEFVEFLASRGVPWPGLAAWVSMGTELVGGVALVAGLLIRPACALLAVNFAVALRVAHAGESYQQSFEALQMLSVVLMLLGTGAGPLSVDAYLRRGAR